jgi:hypothetical protein
MVVWSSAPVQSPAQQQALPHAFDKAVAAGRTDPARRLPQHTTGLHGPDDRPEVGGVPGF